jgi:hypothetical protein
MVILSCVTFLPDKRYIYASPYHENNKELAEKVPKTTALNFTLTSNKNALPYSLGRGLCGFPNKQP